jgi:2'-deoxynucleoside 5'-phosphate N-hydrolase
MVKVFFGCSMRGGFSSLSQDELRKIPELIETLGHKLMSKHQTSATFEKDESILTNKQIHDQDYMWLLGCDCLIAEITNPSLGVGGEISDAAALKKPVLCIYQKEMEKKLSAYTLGKNDSEYFPTIICKGYSNLEELKTIIPEFINNNVKKINIIKSGALMIKDNNYLVVRKKNSPLFILPGGRLEAGENYKECLIRELKEELNIDAGKLDYIKSYYNPVAGHDKDNSISLNLYKVNKWNGELKCSNEIEEFKWIPFKEIEIEMTPLMKEIHGDLVTKK